MTNEFKFVGMTIPKFTITYGVFLVVWATAVSIGVGSKSFTSWIPAMMGGPILISGFMAQAKPNQKKLWMHVAVVFGLLAFLGGGDFFRGFAAEGGPFAKPAAGASKLMLFVTGGLFTFACVKSFIWARKNADA
jgi:hypothetical protein